MCILCSKSNNGRSGLKSFNHQQWTSVQKASNKRLLLSSDKYAAVTQKISCSISDFEGQHYHSSCLSSYTAIKRPRSAGAATETEQTSNSKTRKTSKVHKTNPKGVLEKKCIFCGCQKKRCNNFTNFEKLCLVQTVNESKRIIHLAKSNPSDPLSQRLLSLGSEDLIAIEAMYHSTCELKYRRRTSCEDFTKEISVRQKHTAAFNILVDFVESQVIKQNLPMYISHIYEYYTHEYAKLSSSTHTATREMADYTRQKLTEKLKNCSRMEGKLCVAKESNKTGNFIYSSALCMDDALTRLKQSDSDIEKIRTAALIMRGEIHHMEPTPTPNPVTVHTLKENSPKLPEKTRLFYQTLLGGITASNNENWNRRIDSLASDAIFNTTRGVVRPWKNTALGIGMLSLTGSKTLAMIMNRLGHTTSYDDLKRIETEMAYSNTSAETELPHGMVAKSTLATGCAWDNYDVNVETLTGKDSLHVTVGIAYQNRDPNMKPVQTQHILEDRLTRRSYRGPPKEVLPFDMNLNLAKFQFVAEDNVHMSSLLMTSSPLDVIWCTKVLHCTVPMFNGYFSLYVKDFLPTTVVTYLDPIPFSPTRNDVVYETLERSMALADEIKQPYFPVTYDLNIAVKAYSIQSIMAPKFDRLVILLGEFHLELAFFGAVGTYISDSGLEYLLIESGVLAEGSVNGFVKGKVFNRCTRLHQLVAAVFEAKLFEKFLEASPKDYELILNQIRTTDYDDLEAIRKVTECQEFSSMCAEFEKYLHCAIHNEFGENIAYWAIYVYMINRIYRELQRAVRTNNVELYLKVLPCIADLFYALNRPNYARWCSLFIDKFGTLNKEALEVLKSGAFSIRRSDKSYCRGAVDKTLEETVNRDAASPATGIKAFTTNMDAFRRWAANLTEKSMAVTELKKLADIHREDTPANQLKHYRIKKDNEDMRVISTLVDETINSFEDSDAKLVNIATGKEAGDATSKYLLSTLSRGCSERMKFRGECQVSDARFRKRVAHIKVQNFAAENMTKSVRNCKKLTAAEGVRDAFGHLLSLCITNDTLQNILTYPVTTVPLSIAHSDGTPTKTNKALLTKCLEQKQSTVLDYESVGTADVELLDGGLILHEILSKHKNSTYGTIARAILMKVCNRKSVEIHLLLDRYLLQSIKNCARLSYRSATLDDSFNITGPEQIQKKSGADLLKNSSFKESFSKFLLQEYRKDHYKSVVGTKVVLISHGGHCIKLENKISYMVSEPQQYQASHEEADTLIVYHLRLAKGRVFIRSSDTDVLIIVIGISDRLCDVDVVMDFGIGATRRFIQITDIANNLESTKPGLPKALLGSMPSLDLTTHRAFTGKGNQSP